MDYTTYKTRRKAKFFVWDESWFSSNKWDNYHTCHNEVLVLIKSSRAISRVSRSKIDVSAIRSVPIIISNPDDGEGAGHTKTSIFNQLTGLITREDFINVSRRESLKSYEVLVICIYSVLKWGFRFSLRWVRRWLSFALLRRVVW
jgi:hypothetical protein